MHRNRYTLCAVYWAPPKWPSLSTVVAAAVVTTICLLLGLMGLADVVFGVCLIAMFVIPAIAIRQRPDIWRANLKHKSDEHDQS